MLAPQEAQVQSLVGELRSLMPRGAAKIDKPKKPKQTKILKQSNEERKVILINGIGTTENPLKKKL